jgi:hypothetical protein
MNSIWSLAPGHADVDSVIIYDITWCQGVVVVLAAKIYHVPLQDAYEVAVPLAVEMTA